MKTTSIELRNVGVDFPVFNAWNHSFKNRVLSAVTGGAIDRKFDGSVVVKGLKGINLKIEAGERVGLIGHNGAGKTTLLRVLSGIYAPTEGEAIINGECVSLINIGLGIDPEATGRENIKLRSAMIGFTPKEARDRMEEIVEFSGLGDFIDMPFRTYSTGMQLRLAFAVSTIVSPHILILDEWLSTGDENFRQRAEERMRQVVDSTDILVLASHVPALLKGNCDRVVWLEHGRIRMDGEVAKVLDEYFGPKMQNNQGKRKPDLEAAPKGIPPVEDLMKRLQRSPREIVFEEAKRPGDDVVKLVACRLRRESGKIADSVFSKLNIWSFEKDSICGLAALLKTSLEMPFSGQLTQSKNSSKNQPSLVCIQGLCRFRAAFSRLVSSSFTLRSAMQGQVATPTLPLGSCFMSRLWMT